MDNDDVLSLRLEQYKLAIEMWDRTRTRRQQTNSFYATMNTALVAAIAAKKSAGFISPYICIAGLFLCILWYFNVRRYRSINDAKWNVINAIEECLPLSPFAVEYRNTHKDLFLLTTMELILPWAFIVVYVFAGIHYVLDVFCLLPPMLQNF